MWNLSHRDIQLGLDIRILSSTLSGISLICCMYYKGYWAQIAFAAFFGITRGIYVIQYTLFVVAVSGKTKAHHGFGINLTTRGIVLLIGMPCFGALADLTHDVWGYGVVFICMGACEIVSAVIFLVIRVLWTDDVIIR